MSTTDTPTRRANLRNLDFNSQGEEQLLAALELFLGEGARYIGTNIDDQGFHVAEMDDGPAMIPDGQWKQYDPNVPNLPPIAKDITRWLEGMTRDEKMQVNTSLPYTPSMQALMPRLDGFRIISTRSDDGKHYMLTVIPGWV